MKPVLFVALFGAAILLDASHVLAQAPGGGANDDDATPPTSPAAATSDPQPTGPTGPTAPSSTELTAQQLAVWTSPEMMEARAWVLEYGRRSRQFNEQAAQQYLARVRQLSPEGMQHWLAALAQRRANLARSTQVADAARQRSIAQAYARIDSMRLARENANLQQTQGALTAQEQLMSQQQFAAELSAVRQAGRSDYLYDMYYGRDYGRRLAFPDYQTRVAAAMTLPGDLPAGDPRNFIRGDVPFAGSDVVDANGLPVTPTVDAGAAAAGGAAPAGEPGTP